LLEDSFGNAFAGKYQGNPDERPEEFMRAIKLVYANALVKFLYYLVSKCVKRSRSIFPFNQAYNFLHELRLPGTPKYNIINSGGKNYGA
jgi:hypothetical protein